MAHHQLTNQIFSSLDLVLIAITVLFAERSEGVRSQRTDIHRGATWTAQLLEEQEQRIKEMTRFSKEAFLDLLNWLRDHTGLDDSDQVSAQEKLLIFLFIVAQGAKFRAVAEMFKHSTDTIHKYIH
jgi:hypothetical protein